jgi:hypothetical protein
LYDTTRTTTATEDVVTEDLIRVVKDGVETLAYSSVFEFVHDLDERFKKRAISDVVDEDVINVHLCDTETEAVASIVSSEASESSESIKEAQIDEAQKEEEEEEEDEEYEEEEDEEEEDEEEEEEEDEEDECIVELFNIKIRGRENEYYTDNVDIYEIGEKDEIGPKVGKFVDGKAVMNK